MQDQAFEDLRIKLAASSGIFLDKSKKEYSKKEKRGLFCLEYDNIDDLKAFDKRYELVHRDVFSITINSMDVIKHLIDYDPLRQYVVMVVCGQPEARDADWRKQGTCLVKSFIIGGDEYRSIDPCVREKYRQSLSVATDPSKYARASFAVKKS